MAQEEDKKKNKKEHTLGIKPYEEGEKLGAVDKILKFIGQPQPGRSILQENPQPFLYPEGERIESPNQAKQLFDWIGNPSPDEPNVLLRPKEERPIFSYEHIKGEKGEAPTDVTGSILKWLTNPPKERSVLQEKQPIFSYEHMIRKPEPPKINPGPAFGSGIPNRPRDEIEKEFLESRVGKGVPLPWIYGGPPKEEQGFFNESVPSVLPEVSPEEKEKAKYWDSINKALETVKNQPVADQRPSSKEELAQRWPLPSDTKVPPGGEQVPSSEQLGESEEFGELGQFAQKDAQEMSKGVTTHDEADAKLRSTMGDDPELQSAIMEVRARLADAKKPESYGITDYLTAILLTLGGTPPTHAIEYVTQRGYKQGKADELEKQLLQLQMAGVGARRRQQEQGTQMDFQKEMLKQRLGSQEDIEGAKLGLQENKAGADYNRKLLSSYLQAQSQQMDPKEKVKYQTIINALQQQLQIPGGSIPPKPKPTSMVDPRLQRMGLNPGGSFA